MLPTQIATAESTKQCFGALIEQSRLASFFSFLEIRQWFPDTDDRNPFGLLTVTASASNADFAFFLNDPSDIKDPRRRFGLSAQEIALINPNTKTAPVFRSHFDAELTAKIYSRVPVLINESRAEQGNPWGISFMAMFHMSNASALFRTSEQLRDIGYERRGPEWVLPSNHAELSITGEPGDLDHPGDIAVHPKDYVPLYEQNLMHQYNHRFARFEGKKSLDLDTVRLSDPEQETEPRYWVPKSVSLERIHRKGWSNDWLIGWRRTARNGDIRSLLVAVLPSCGIGDSIFLLSTKYSAETEAALLGCLNSIGTDYVFRQKLSGDNTSFYFLEQLAVLPPEFFTEAHLAVIIPRVLELTYTSHSISGFARDLGYTGPPFPWNEDRRALLRAELDAWYAHAYGLTRDELRYILDPAEVMGPDYPSETFRVLKNNEIREHGEYLTRRLVLEAWDRMERGELPCPEPYDRNRSIASTPASPATGSSRPANGQSQLEFAEESTH
jgi:hypothetical protein